MDATDRETVPASLGMRVEALGPLLALIASLNGLDVSRIALAAVDQERDDVFAAATGAAVEASASRKEDWASLAQGFAAMVGPERQHGVPYPAELARSSAAAAAVQRALRAILCADALDPAYVDFAVAPLAWALGREAVDEAVARVHDAAARLDG